MICPHCDSQKKSGVLDTRKSGDDILRRRECSACSGTFVTLESVDEFAWPDGCRTAQQRAESNRKGPLPDGPWSNGALHGAWR